MLIMVSRGKNLFVPVWHSIRLCVTHPIRTRIQFHCLGTTFVRSHASSTYSSCDSYIKCTSLIPIKLMLSFLPRCLTHAQGPWGLRNLFAACEVSIIQLSNTVARTPGIARKSSKILLTYSKANTGQASRHIA